MRSRGFTLIELLVVI
ncbi:MAG: prepilin-type N-terminal cleavage/methylation domain-containing protein, partial [Verrucomicrobiota bacterium]